MPEFLALMAERHRIRVRDGARHWTLMRDLERPAALDRELPDPDLGRVHPPQPAPHQGRRRQQPTACASSTAAAARRVVQPPHRPPGRAVPRRACPKRRRSTIPEAAARLGRPGARTATRGSRPRARPARRGPTCGRRSAPAGGWSPPRCGRSRAMSRRLDALQHAARRCRLPPASAPRHRTGGRSPPPRRRAPGRAGRASPRPAPPRAPGRAASSPGRRAGRAALVAIQTAADTAPTSPAHSRTSRAKSVASKRSPSWIVSTAASPIPRHSTHRASTIARRGVIPPSLRAFVARRPRPEALPAAILRM